jgi:hypothetical protein
MSFQPLLTNAIGPERSWETSAFLWGEAIWERGNRRAATSFWDERVNSPSGSHARGLPMEKSKLPCRSEPMLNALMHRPG